MFYIIRAYKGGYSMDIKLTGVTQNEEIDKLIRQKYGDGVADFLKNNVGKTLVNINEESQQILQQAEKMGFIEMETIDKDDKVLEQTEEKEDIEEKEEEKEDIEEIEEEKEMVAERKKYEIKYLKTRAMTMLERIEAYRELPMELQRDIMLAYDKAADVGDIWDENFLKKHLPLDEGTKFSGNTSKIHLMVLGGLKVQNHIIENQEIADVQMEQAEIDEQSVSEANSMRIRLPKIIGELDPYLKADAERDLANKMKKYIELATTNKPATEALIIIGDFEKYSEELKKDYANSIEGTDKNEAIKRYIAQTSITEMTDVISAVKSSTGNVKISFEDVDWSNEVERNVAINLLSKTQDSLNAFENVEPLIDKVEVTFDIDNMDDAKQMQKACDDLGAIAKKQGVQIVANVEIADNIDEEERMQIETITETALAENNIDNENNANQDIPSEIGEGLIAGQLGAIAVEAAKTPKEIGKFLDEIGNGFVKEISSGQENSNT